MPPNSRGSDGHLHVARPVDIGPLSVHFSSGRADITERWDDLYAAFPSTTAGANRIDIEIAEDDGALVSSIDGNPLLTDPDLRKHELTLSRAINHRKLNEESQLVHLHAAAIARHGRAALLAGRSGDGKSTLTARLVQRGWDYVTDEQVTFDATDQLVLPYPRPLTLRRKVWHLFPGIGDDADSPHYRRVETSLRELGGTAASDPVAPLVIIAPKYAADADNALAPFADVADVVQFLASVCHDLERTETRGCATLVRLASTLPARRLRFNDVDAAADLVDEAFSGARSHAAVSVVRIDTAEDTPGIGGLLQRSPGSTAWLFGDGSGIAFQPNRLRLARLDTLACALWQALDTPDTPEAILADAPNETTRVALQVWVDRLLEAGLLRTGSARPRSSGQTLSS